jgi:hypothetical protein
VVRLHGGKRYEMPAHHKLEQFLDEYLAAAGIRENGKNPLFRSALGKTGCSPTSRWTASTPTADAEGIHQMRVAVRRWRATLSALAPFMPEGSRRSASNELRWVADALSEARNLDVFASAVLAPARRPPRH